MYMVELTRAANYKRDPFFSFHYTFELLQIVHLRVVKVNTMWQAIYMDTTMAVWNLPVLLSSSTIW